MLSRLNPCPPLAPPSAPRRPAGDAWRDETVGGVSMEAAVECWFFTAGKTVRALILAPTRELAAQIADSFKTYGRFARLSVGVVVGGVSLMNFYTAKFVHDAPGNKGGEGQGVTDANETQINLVRRIVDLFVCGSSLCVFHVRLCF